MLAASTHTESQWLDAPILSPLKKLSKLNPAIRSTPCLVAFIFTVITQDQAAFADQMTF